MNNLDHFLQRNKEFAAQQSAEGTLMPSLLRAMPNVKAFIIGCADMRVDPAHAYSNSNQVQYLVLIGSILIVLAI